MTLFAAFAKYNEGLGARFLRSMELRSPVTASWTNWPVDHWTLSSKSVQDRVLCNQPTRRCLHMIISVGSMSKCASCVAVQNFEVSTKATLREFHSSSTIQTQSFLIA